MPEGASATAEQEVPLVQETQPGDVNVEGQEPESPEQLKIRLARTEERYSYSSAEGKRLYEENKKLQERLTTLEKGKDSSSLTTQNQSLPDVNTIMRYKMEQVGMDEKAARHQAEIEVGMMSQMRALQVQNQALANQMRFQNEQNSRLAVESNPIFKEAEQFFADIPEMAGVSPADKVERLRAFKAKMNPQASGRDTSAIKGAAGSTVGDGTASQPTAATQNEQIAKDSGFGNFKQMEDFAGVKTDADYKAYKQRWKLK